MITISTRSSRNRGFSLLEVVISLGLIATALLAVVQLQAQNLDLQTEAQFITIANLLAQDRLARIMAAASLAEGSSSGDFGDDFPLYAYREEISQVSELEHLFRVTVTIVLDGEGNRKDLSWETFLYRLPT
jgi:prepilin-type N-terminal cleavage/methylation domain-containing protein